MACSLSGSKAPAWSCCRIQAAGMPTFPTRKCSPRSRPSAVGCAESIDEAALWVHARRTLAHSDASGGSHASTWTARGGRVHTVGFPARASPDRDDCRHRDRSIGGGASGRDGDRDEQRHRRFPGRPVGLGRRLLGSGAAPGTLRRAHRDVRFPAHRQSRRSGHRRDGNRPADPAGQLAHGSRQRRRCDDDGGSVVEPGAGRGRASANRQPAAERTQLPESRPAPAGRDRRARQPGPVQRAVQRLRARRPGVAHGDHHGRRQYPEPRRRGHRPELLPGGRAGVPDFDGEFRPVDRHYRVRRDQRGDAVGFQRFSRRRLHLLSRSTTWRPIRAWLATA